MIHIENMKDSPMSNYELDARMEQIGLQANARVDMLQMKTNLKDDKYLNMSKRQRLLAVVWRSVVFGPLIIILLFLLIVIALNSNYFFDAVSHIFVFGYVIGAPFALIISFLVGYISIYKNYSKDRYIFLVCITITFLFIILIPYVYCLIFNHKFDIKNSMVFFILLTINSIISSSFCRYFFRHYLLKTTHDLNPQPH